MSSSQITDLENVGSDDGRGRNSVVDAVNGTQAGLIPSSGGISSGIPGDHRSTVTEDDTLPSQRSQRPEDCETLALINQQHESPPTGGVMTNDVSQRTEAINQSRAAVQSNRSTLHGLQNVVEKSPSSFLLCRDGQVTHII